MQLPIAWGDRDGAGVTVEYPGGRDTPVGWQLIFLQHWSVGSVTKVQSGGIFVYVGHLKDET